MTNDPWSDPIPALRCIVAESGAPPIDYGELLRADGLEADVLVQSADELPGDFGVRSRRRVEALVRSRQIGEAVLCVSAHSSAHLLAERTALVSTLLRALFRGGHGGEVVLRAPADASPDLRHELLGLADAVFSELQGGAVSIRFRFDTKEALPAPLVDSTRAPAPFARRAARARYAKPNHARGVPCPSS